MANAITVKQLEDQMYRYYKLFERIPYTTEDFHYKVARIKHKTGRSRFIRNSKKRGKRK